MTAQNVFVLLQRFTYVQQACISSVCDFKWDDISRNISFANPRKDAVFIKPCKFALNGSDAIQIVTTSQKFTNKKLRMKHKTCFRSIREHKPEKFGTCNPTKHGA